MKLTGPDTFFELDILDYEYGDSSSFMDRNWLLISLKSGYKGKQSTTTAPLLSTWEIELLIKWMESLYTEQKLSPSLSFVEPCLGFSLAPDSFRIKLDHEASPDWNKEYDSTPFWLSVKPNQEELRRAITDLQRQLSHFPVRD